MAERLGWAVIRYGNDKRLRVNLDAVARVGVSPRTAPPGVKLKMIGEPDWITLRCQSKREAKMLMHRLELALEIEELPPPAPNVEAWDVINAITPLERLKEASRHQGCRLKPRGRILDCVGGLWGPEIGGHGQCLVLNYGESVGRDSWGLPDNFTLYNVRTGGPALTGAFFDLIILVDRPPRGLDTGE